MATSYILHYIEEPFQKKKIEENAEEALDFYSSQTIKIDGKEILKYKIVGIEVSKKNAEKSFIVKDIRVKPIKSLTENHILLELG